MSNTKNDETRPMFSPRSHNLCGMVHDGNPARIIGELSVAVEAQLLELGLEELLAPTSCAYRVVDRCCCCAAAAEEARRGAGDGERAGGRGEEAGERRTHG